MAPIRGALFARRLLSQSRRSACQTLVRHGSAKPCRPAIAAVVAGLAGCAVDLSVPEGARISCADEQQCPEGFVCNVSSSLCVPTGTTDAVAPQVIPPVTVSPSTAMHDAQVSVSFVVDEPLLQPPTVTCVNGGRVRPLELAHDQAGETPVYAFRYVVQNDEVEETSPLRVVMVDHAGNTTDTELGVGLRFDFTPPEIAEGSATLRIVPPDEYPIRYVTAARAGATIELSFATSEPLSASRSVVAVSDSTNETFVFEEVGEGATTFLFRHQVATGAAPVDATFWFHVAIADEAGNETEVDIDATSQDYPDGLHVDTIPPVAPAVDEVDELQDARVVYHRIPWGTEITGGNPLFALSGAPGATESGALVLAFADESGLGDSELGRTSADSQGAFGAAPGMTPVFSLGANDRAEVFVAAADAAGNSSPVVRVRDVDWVASMIGKEAGSYIVNPHSFEWRRIHTRALEQALPNRVGEESGIGREDGATLVTEGGATWTRVGTASGSSFYGISTQIPAASDGQASFDPARGVAVYYGGMACGCASTSALAACQWVWERKGLAWSRRLPIDPEQDGNPAARLSHGQSYDGKDEGVLVFGGRPSLLGTSSPFGDTWLWNGTSWREMCTTAACAVNAPSARWGAAMAYDIERGRTVLFGGSDGGDETWEWDGVRWQQVCLESPCADNVPSARTGHAMAYEPANSILLFGGSAGADETWRFDGQVWTPLCTTGPCDQSRPPARQRAALGYDPNNEAMILYGGVPEPPGPVCHDALDDAWQWKDGAWSLLSPIDPEGDGDPPALFGPSLVFDVARSRAVLVGGYLPDDRPGGECIYLECELEQTSPSTVSWDWTGSSWRSVDQGTIEEPASAVGPRLAYDPRLGRIMLFGGCEGGTCNADYTFNGVGWVPVPGGQPSPLRAGPAIAYDTTHRALIVFGGADSGGTVLGDTWQRTGSGWSQTCTGICVHPAGLNGAAMAYSDVASGVLMFGGDDGSGATNGTYAWTGSGWSALCTAAPCNAALPEERTGATMAYDFDTRRTFLFGGTAWGWSVYESSLYEWTDRGGWVVRGAGDPHPLARGAHAMTYDGARQRIVLHGGSHHQMWNDNCGEGVPQCLDTWEWDPATDVWKKPSIVDPEGDGDPAGMENHAMAFDQKTGQTLLFGASPQSGESETWLWDGGAQSGPAHLMRVVFGAAGAGDATLLDLDIHWVAGGDGSIPGASLQLWSLAGWRQLASTSAGVGTEAAIDWSSRAQAVPQTGRKLRPYLQGSLSTIVLAVTPTATNGAESDYARVATDSAQLRVRYRLPLSP